MYVLDFKKMKICFWMNIVDFWQINIRFESIFWVFKNQQFLEQLL